MVILAVMTQTDIPRLPSWSPYTVRTPRSPARAPWVQNRRIWSAWAGPPRSGRSGSRRGSFSLMNPMILCCRSSTSPIITLATWESLGILRTKVVFGCKIKRMLYEYNPMLKYSYHKQTDRTKTRCPEFHSNEGGDQWERVSSIWMTVKCDTLMFGRGICLSESDLFSCLSDRGIPRFASAWKTLSFTSSLRTHRVFTNTIHRRGVPIVTSVHGRLPVWWRNVATLHSNITSF